MPTYDPPCIVGLYPRRDHPRNTRESPNESDGGPLNRCADFPRKTKHGILEFFFANIERYSTGPIRPRDTDGVAFEREATRSNTGQALPSSEGSKLAGVRPRSQLPIFRPAFMMP